MRFPSGANIPPALPSFPPLTRYSLRPTTIPAAHAIIPVGPHPVFLAASQPVIPAKAGIHTPRLIDN